MIDSNSIQISKLNNNLEMLKTKRLVRALDLILVELFVYHL